MGITNDVTGGRFVDNVIQYIKTKWFAYTYGLDFYFQPFKEAKYINASRLEQRCTTNIGNRYSRRIEVRAESDITSNIRPGILFIVKSYAAGYYLTSQFDCLIKSESTFSSISQLLGSHAITIVP